MKKITALLLILCLSAALFACSEEPEETNNGTTDVIQSDTATETATESFPAGTDTETENGSQDTANETDPEQLTETETEEITETEPAQNVKTVYSVYDPTLAGYDYNGTLTLYESGEYLSQTDSLYDSYGVSLTNQKTEKGTYELDESGADLELRALTIEYKLVFNDNNSKETYQNNIKEAYLSGTLDSASYNILKKAASGGFSGGVSEFADSELFSAAASGLSKAVIDKEENTVYYLVPGIMPSDNEYYITDTGYMLALYSGGKCRMYYESVGEDEKGFGSFIVSDIYDGTYVLSQNEAVCTITENTIKRSFTDAESENAYREYYESQYSQGFLGKVYYDYYMALISTGGYTDDDYSDVYIIELEEHTHTARIIESPETEL